MKKSELRKIYLQKRRDSSPEKLLTDSRNICRTLFEKFDFTEIYYLHCFVSIRKFNEIDTSLIFEKIWKDFPQIKTVVPRINRENNLLESVEFSEETKLERNSWGIAEPIQKDTIESRLIDAVLIPLLCFDEKGFRVGYGKGYYDKFLKNCRADCLKIGMSFFPPIPQIEDIHEFDIPLDCCITPEKIYGWQNQNQTLNPKH